MAGRVAAATLVAMNDGIGPSSSPHHDRERLNWAVVAGLGALALLWPVARLVGLFDVFGQAATAIGIVVLVGLVWVLGAGFGRAPRPVLTLTLAGALYGLLSIVLMVVVGGGRLGSTLWLATLIETGRGAGLGALCGLLARLIQGSRGRR